METEMPSVNRASLREQVYEILRDQLDQGELEPGSVIRQDEIAEKLGVTFRHTIEKRIEGAASVGAHKTSMLQDVELGRSLETEALVGSILEIAELTETPAPSIKAVYACVKLLNKVMLTEGGGVRLNSAA